MSFRKIAAVCGLSLLTSLAFAFEVKTYSAPELAAAQAAGNPVAVHFLADWCPTCRAQAQMFELVMALPDRWIALTTLF